MGFEPFSITEIVSPSALANDNVTASVIHLDRLFLGTDKGALLVFDLAAASTSTNPTPASLISRNDSFVKKTIDQLGVFTPSSTLVCLSGGDVTLHSLTSSPSLQLLRSLSPQTKSQCSLFHLLPTAIALACRRRFVLVPLSLTTGTPSTASGSPGELNLPHQIRGMSLAGGGRGGATAAGRGGEESGRLVAGFSTGEYGVISLPPVSALALGELFTPPQTTEAGVSGISGSTATGSGASGGGAGGTSALSISRAAGGLGGLAKATGFGAFVGATKVEKNEVVAMPPRTGWKKDDEGWLWSSSAGWKEETDGDGDVLLVRENLALQYTSLGKTKPGLTFPAAVDEMLALAPYLFTLLPASTSTSSNNNNNTTSITAPPTLDIRATPNLAPIQSIPLPGLGRLLSSPAGVATGAGGSGETPEGPVVLISATSGVAGVATGQAVQLIKMRSWASQVEALIGQGKSELATLLLRNSTTNAVPPPLLRRLSTLRVFTQFTLHSAYETAIDGCIALDISPARVVALYPAKIAGKLTVTDDRKEGLFGGREEEVVRAIREDEEEATKAGAEEVEGEEGEGKDTSDTASLLGTVASAVARSPVKARGGTGWLKDHARLGSHVGSPTKPDAQKQQKLLEQAELAAFRRSVDALIRYLTDRRQKCAAALAALAPSLRPTPATLTPVSGAVLLELPDAPPGSLKSEQLARVAQVVDTALFRAYLATKPVMVGPLCRIENWCEVEEVEELLLNAKKYRELLDLYNGKNMHDRAVKLLKQMSEEEDDPEEKVGPSIRYLQKLGGAHKDLIFDASRWILEADRKAGIEIFIADLEEVETLPRHDTMHHLERIGTDLCATYLEHIIHHLGEQGAEFHEKLIEIYLAAVHSESSTGGDPGDATYKKLIALLESSTAYRADRILGRLPSDDMHRVRAILLGRLGRHEGALQIYVYQLDDHATAEEYCKRVYENDEAMRPTIFHILLRIYLRPRPSHPLLFAPALALISAHASSISAIEVFDLLPPLVALDDIKIFLTKTLRRSGERAREAKTLKGISRSLVEQKERDVVDLEERRVKITESRVCPQCHKRLGNSVIAIHSPHGEVTHYQCRDDFVASKRQ